MLKNVINGLDSIFMWLSTKLKYNLSDYCDIETAMNSTTLVARDGSLVTVVRVDGIRTITSIKTFWDQIVKPLEISFTAYMEKTGHTAQFWYSFDPAKTKKHLAEMMEPNIETCKRLQLDLGQMFEEKLSVLPEWTSYEECYVVLWTSNEILSKSEKNEARKRNIDNKKEVVTPLLNGQDPYAFNTMLVDRHNSYVSSIVDELLKADIVLQPLNVYEACRKIRQSIDDTFTSESWEPFLPNDKMTPQLRKYYTKAQEWDIVWPKVSWQVCPRDAKAVTDNFVQIGDYVYAPMYVDLMPKEPKNFASLFSTLLNKKMPWRISFIMAGDGLSAVMSKKLAASVLSFSSQDNKLLNEGIKQLQYLQEKEQKTIVKFSISLATWCHVNEKRDLSRRLSELSAAIQNWGSCQVSDVTGDPIAGVVSSALGFSKNSIATVSAAPIEETLFMLPLARPTSPWKKGGVVFRSPNGKLMPYQPGSTLQATWVTLIFAGPGSGKSVLLNGLNLALATKEGNTRLPKIGIIDIGPSSSGLVSLVKESLPSNKRHLVSHYRMRMTEEFCINPLDTQLGCRFPTAEESAFLKNFLTLLVTDPNTEKAPQGMTGLVSTIVEELYLQKSDLYSPNKFEEKVNYRVDEALEKAGFVRDLKTTWWEVVDFLFDKGYTHEAHLAQRYAVPVLADTTEIAQTEKIKMIYNNPVSSETQETLIQAFTRGVSEALNLYKILGKPTVFDIGESRITSIDLDEVAKTGGPIADRQTAIMYMLARFILAKDYKIINETVNEMPYPVHLECPKNIPVKKYKEYHLKKVQEMRDDIKRLCFDEFHRTSKSNIVREQVLVDMREGRKWNMDILLASQSLEDFDERMREFTTSVFIMAGGNEETVKKICDVFGVDDPVEKIVLSNGSVHPPKKGGGTFLAKFFTNQGRYTQLLSYTLGPAELWSFSTTAEEVNIRDRLYKKVGPVLARKMLVSTYPSPSDAREEVLNRMHKMKERNVDYSEEVNVYDGLVNEIIDKYNLYYR